MGVQEMADKWGTATSGDVDVAARQAGTSRRLKNSASSRPTRVSLLSIFHGRLPVFPAFFTGCRSSSGLPAISRPSAGLSGVVAPRIVKDARE